SEGSQKDTKGASESVADRNVGASPTDRSVSVTDPEPNSPDSKSTAEQLTETLRSANGPPTAGSPANTATTIVTPTFTTYSPSATEVTPINLGGTAGAGVNPNGNDQYQVSGLATLNGTLKIQLVNGYVPTLGDSLVVMTWGSRSGEFANYLGTANIPGGG